MFRTIVRELSDKCTSSNWLVVLPWRHNAFTTARRCEDSQIDDLRSIIIQRDPEILSFPLGNT